MAAHQWVKSTLGHGDAMCAKCFITNREAALLRRLDFCSKSEAEDESADDQPAFPVEQHRPK